ncbi:MAG: folate-binding protein [Rhizobiaceae bacterium]|nr:folate-binding protein [Rhizobiaceae bacterium]
MAQQYSSELANRALLKIGGEQAEVFLQGILTGNVEDIADKSAGFSGLLSPQGKILFDFFVIRDGKSFLIDVDKTLEDELLKRLTFYRLRADVTLEAVKDGTRIFALWGGSKPDSDGAIIAADPRLAKLGWRQYSSANPVDAITKPAAEYHAHRIELGMPQGGEDYTYGATFPHEALYDQNNAVDFSKGCYVGQEVISRVHHRGTARKRIIQVSTETELPAKGTQIIADGKTLGEMCSVSNRNGLAILRLDRVRDAHAADSKISADGIDLNIQIQSWADFGWPDAK